MDNKNPKGLKNLLPSSEDRDARNKVSSSDAAAKKSNDLVEENINPQILSVLGLEDVFDLTYEEYASLLKEAAVRGRMPNSQMTTESVELVTNELKRVRGKTGRFKVKQKKISIDKVLDRKAPSPSSAIVRSQKLLPPTLEKEETDIVKTKTSQDEIQIGVQNILTSLVTIRGLLEGQSKSDQETAKVEKKKVEKNKKRDREDALEKKKEDKFKLPKAISTPVDNFFESIKTYFKNILLGSVVLGLYRWLKNPANEKTINDFGNFLTNNAPLILGGLLAIAALPIASTLLSLSLGVLTGVGTLISAMGALSAFLLSPAGLGLLAGFGLYGLARKYREGRDKEQERKMQEAERGRELIEQGGKPITARTPSGVATIKQGNIPLWDLGAQWGNLQNKLFGKKDITKSEDLDELKREYNRVNNDLYHRMQIQKSGIVRPDPKIPDLQVQKNILSQRIKEVEQFVPKDEPKIQPQTPKVSPYKSPFAEARDREALKASKITGNAPITVGEKAGYSASRGRIHAGRDIAAPSGTGLQVSSDSVIIDKGFEDGYGNFIVFRDSNGIEHLYGHMLEASPYNKGDQVPAGTVIGRVGSTGRSTGPHLHWEVSRVMGEVGKPRANIIDPIEIGFPAEAPFTGKVEAAQLAQTKPSTPSIPSPTGRSNIIPLPIPMQTQQASQSNSAPLQTPVPFFSSEDPNNMTTFVVKAIYNVVG